MTKKFFVGFIAITLLVCCFPAALVTAKTTKKKPAKKVTTTTVVRPPPSSTTFLPADGTSTSLATTTVAPLALGCRAGDLPVPRLTIVPVLKVATARFDLDATAITESAVRPTFAMTFTAREIAITSNTARFTVTATRRSESGTDCVESSGETFQADIRAIPAADGSVDSFYFSPTPTAAGGSALANSYLDASPKAIDVFLAMVPLVKIPQLRIGAQWPTVSVNQSVSLRVTDGSPTQPRLTNGATGIVVASAGVISVSAPTGTGSVNGAASTKFVLRLSASTA
jgi:hypothetical protein